MTLALAALLLAQVAPAPVQWERMAADRDGYVSIDPASIRRSGDRVHFDMRLDFFDPAAIGAHSGIFDTYVDCRRRISGFTRIRGFDADGNQTMSRTLAEDDPLGRAQPMDMNAASDIALDRRLCGGPSS